MEIKHIETFLAIMKEGSFTKAAELLGYTQSSMTAHIRTLEKDLSVKLFERLSRLNTPTAAAWEFLPYAEGLLRDQENAVNAMLRFSGKMESTVVIAASEAILMAEEMRKFSEDFPEVGLKVKVHSCPEIPALVSEGEADFGFFVGTEGQDISPLRLLSARLEPTYLVGKPGSFKSRSIGEILSRENFIVNAKGRVYSELAKNRFRELGIVPRIIEAGSIPAVKELVMSGLGISLLPECSIWRELRNAMIESRPLEASSSDPVPMAMLVVHKQKVMTPAMTEICTRIKHSFAERKTL
jgi:DNA-binding transcriptional LysR family regulator